MRPEDIFEIIDGIDDDIILDIPELNAEKPMRIAVKTKQAPLWAVTLSAACLLCVLAAAVFFIARSRSEWIDPNPYGPTSSDDSSYQNDTSSDSSDNSDSVESSVPESSDPELDNNSKDPDGMGLVRLGHTDLPQLALSGATAGLDPETLCSVRSDDDLTVMDLYLTEAGPVLWMSSYPMYHYFTINQDGSERSHIQFNFYEHKEHIPNLGYLGGDVYVADGEVLFYKNGVLQRTVSLPQRSRSSFSEDHSQLLYIDPEKTLLVLFDLQTETVLKELSVNDLGLSAEWIFDFVNIVSSKYAVVTLRENDPNAASEYQGNENLGTYLLELPSLNVIRRLPDGAYLTALDDENFLMTKQEGTTRGVSRVRIENGELSEESSELIINENSPFFASQNITLSPNKKTALLLDHSGSYLRCRAVSADNLQVLWEANLSEESGTLSPGYPPAVITDEAEMYIVGSSWESSEKYLYRVSMK